MEHLYIWECQKEHGYAMEEERLERNSNGKHFLVVGMKGMRKNLSLKVIKLHMGGICKILLRERLGFGV